MAAQSVGQVLAAGLGYLAGANEWDENAADNLGEGLENLGENARTIYTGARLGGKLIQAAGGEGHEGGPGAQGGTSPGGILSLPSLSSTGTDSGNGDDGGVIVVTPSTGAASPDGTLPAFTITIVYTGGSGGSKTLKPVLAH